MAAMSAAENGTGEAGHGSFRDCGPTLFPPSLRFSLSFVSTWLAQGEEGAGVPLALDLSLDSSM